MMCLVKEVQRVGRSEVWGAVVKVLACVAATAGCAIAAVPASADVRWLCRPGLPFDPCQIRHDTTINEPDGSSRVEDPGPLPRTPPVDCFYVYPTVSNQLTPNATKARDLELRSIAKYQAARFNRKCRMFAPIYRQATLVAIQAGTVAPPDREMAYQDVLEAWRAYLAKDNGGRGVVLIGHSQGTGVLRRLLREEIDPSPALRAKLVGAYLIGGNVLVAEGATTGGDFQNVPTCTARAQTGCVVAFSTFAKDPPADARFGRTTMPGKEVACTDPRVLAGTTDPLRVLVPSEPFAPGIILAGIVVTSGGVPPFATTTWVVPRDRAAGACREYHGAVNVLRLEAIGRSRTPGDFPDATWGTHLLDMNIALEPMVSLVGQQTERWLAAR